MKLNSEYPTVLVTGGGKRLGAAMARHLHANGYNLALHCRHSITETQMLVAELERQRACSTMLLQADLVDATAPDRLIDAVLAKSGRLDALVNNAAVFLPTPVGHIDLAQWDELVIPNVRAPLFLAQAAVAPLSQCGGSIVNLVDIYAERPLSRHPIYCMTKAALKAMTRSLALDLAPDVRVNGVAPGQVLWPDSHGIGDDADKCALLARTPLRRIGTPEDVASAVLWLVRDAPFVTGQIITVDGGRMLSI